MTSAPRLSRKTATTVMLGLAQTLAWGSSYYLPAVLAASIAGACGMAVSTVFAAFSMALLVAAATGPLAGRLIDRFGGRPVLVASNLVFACGLSALSQAGRPWQVFAAWAVMGLAMGSGLYEAAFATVVRLHGREARSAITGITLIAGFASTVGWPLSAAMEHAFGWRGACLGWAALHLLVACPLNLLLPHAQRAEPASTVGTPPADAAARDVAPLPDPRRAALLMAFVFAATWFNSTAMAAHLPALLSDSGVALGMAVGIAALVGPAQVAGRVIEFSFLRRAHPLLSARLATLGHPLAALCLGLLGAQGGAAFAVLHGLGNGILTIAIGTLPLLVFGPQGYGRRQGLLMVPARIVQAGAPFLYGLALSAWGTGALWLSAGLALLACLALHGITGLGRASR